MRKILCLSILAILTSAYSYGQVKINEYSCSNMTGFPDSFGNHSDWVEFYNSGSGTVNMGGMYLTDDPNVANKFQIPAGVSIPAGGFLRVWCSGKGNIYGGDVHTNFKLTQCKGEWIMLVNNNAIVDSLQLRRTQLEHSWGRTPDGSPNWKVYTTPTPNATNSGTGYDGYAPTPVMTPTAGYYPGAQNVTMTVPGPNTTIRYTTTGLEPNSSSTVYTSGVAIASTSVLRAICYSSNPAILPSFMETNTYLINENIFSKYGVVSVSGDYPTLFSTQNVQRTHIEYFENGAFVTEGYGTSDKHGNDSWAFPQKGFDVRVKDDYGYSDALYCKFFVDPEMGTSKRKSFQHVIMKAAASDNFPSSNTGKGCHMRDAFVQTYAFKKNLELDGRRCKPVIGFVNGQYWGIYELREAFETDYTDYYYNQPSDSIDNLAYWGGLQIRDGSDTGWVNLYNFVMGNSMTNPANYAYVNSKLNFKSIIDYMVYNSYVVNSDFVNWNSAWWRGRALLGDKKKWRYWMWDMDNTYDLGENYSGIPTTGMTADPCAYSTTFQNAGPDEGHPDILAKLLTNPDFKSQYINRYADLINTSFKCDSIMIHYNYFKSFLTPEMTRHIAKWGGSLSTWNQNMDTLKSKITQRCSYIEAAIKNCYNVTGPYPVTVDVDPAGAGDVKLNTIWLHNFQWTGNYFGGVRLTFETKSLDTAKYEFDHWEFQNHSPSPGNTSDSVSINFTQADHVIAHYREKAADVVLPTGFTPNGDGVNDVFMALGTRYVKNFSFEIWNRWGQRVFYTTDPTKGWDGSLSGSPAQTGVYAYFVKYTDGKNEEKSVKGNVTLIR